MRLLAYGMTADTIDEYLKLGKTITLECLENYCDDIIDCVTRLSSYMSQLLSLILNIY
jgi:hypothetical protein